jgi:heterodisulfide reductase subunit C
MKLSKQLKEFIIKEIKRIKTEENLKEISGTAGCAGYSTPDCFSTTKKNHKMKRIASHSIPGGKVTNEESDNTDLIKENRYRNFLKDSSIKRESKLSYMVSEVNKMLKEVNYLVNISGKLQNENISLSWKRSPTHLEHIKRTLKEISRKLEAIK